MAWIHVVMLTLLVGCSESTDGHKRNVSMVTMTTVRMVTHEKHFELQSSTMQPRHGSEQTLYPTEKTRNATEQTLDATGETLDATEQTLDAIGETLNATEQTLDATGETLDATDQTLDANEQTLDATEQTPNATGETLSVAEAASVLLPYRIGLYIHIIWLPIVVVVGSVGNMLSLLVMLQPHNRRISCCVYMAALAVSDMMMLYLAAHYYLVTGPIRYMHDLECVILATMFQMFSLTGILIVLSMTVDRFIAVRYPFKASTLCTPRRARITIVAIFVFSVAYGAPFLTTAGLANPSTCLAVKSKSTFALAYSWLNTVINSLVPFSVLLVLNTLIIRTIKRRGKYFSRDQRDTKDSKREGKESAQKADNTEAQLTATLLTVTFVLLTLTLPQYVRYVLAVFIDYTSDAHAYSAFMLFVHFTNKLYFTNNGINFFLYCIGGSKFREDLRVIFRRCAPGEGKGGARGRSPSTASGMGRATEKVGGGGAVNPSNMKSGGLATSTATLASELGN